MFHSLLDQQKHSTSVIARDTLPSSDITTSQQFPDHASQPLDPIQITLNKSPPFPESTIRAQLLPPILGGHVDDENLEGKVQSEAH